MIVPASEWTFDAYQRGDYGDHCVIHGDCRDVLPKIPDKAIDLVLTDPPYNVGIDYENGVDDNKTVDDFKEWVSPIFFELRRISKRTLISTGQSNLALYGCLEPFIWVIAWIKPNAMNRGRCGDNRFEPLALWGKGSNRGQDYFMAPTTMHYDGHPCSKPIKWALKPMAMFNSPLIFDPFLGSGTTLVAAKNLGRRAIGIEINYDYCVIAENRLRQEVLAI